MEDSMHSKDVVKELLDVRYIEVLNFPLHSVLIQADQVSERIARLEYTFELKNTALKPYIEDVCLSNKTSEYTQSRILFILKNTAYKQTVLEFLNNAFNTDPPLFTFSNSDALHYIELDELNLIRIDLYTKKSHLSTKEELIYSNGQITDRHNIFKILPFRSGNRLYWGVDNNAPVIEAVITKEAPRSEVVFMPLCDTREVPDKKEEKEEGND
jgi:hypothetical protein